jgi:hypothetical protein
MRLTRFSLAAAATLLALPAIAPAIDYSGGFFYTTQPDYYRITTSTGPHLEGSSYTLRNANLASASVLSNPTGTALLIVDQAATITLSSVYSTTFSGMFFGEGNIVKDGEGTLQYNGGRSDRPVSVDMAYITTITGNPDPEIHPAWGYFRNATNGATSYRSTYETNPKGKYGLHDLETMNYGSVAHLLVKEGYGGFGIGDFIATHNYPGLIEGALSMMPNFGGVVGGFISNHVSLGDRATMAVDTVYGNLGQLGNEPLAKMLVNTGIYKVKYSEDPNDIRNWQSYGDTLYPTFRFDRTRDEEGNYRWVWYPGTLERPWYFTPGTIFYNGESTSNGPSQAYGGLSGTFTINAGELDVAGYLSHWREFPGAPNDQVWGYDAILAGADTPAMVGVGSTVLKDGSRKITRNEIPAAGDWEDSHYGQATLVTEEWVSGATVLRNNAKLSFRNTEYNITNATPTIPYDGRDNGVGPDPHSPNTIALNFVHNLQTGTLIPPDPDNPDRDKHTVETTEWIIREDPRTGRPIYKHGEPLDEGADYPLPYLYDETVKRITIEIPRYTNDQHQTELEVGINAPDHRLIAHQDLYVDGSIGIISGTGRFFKTGPGSLSILNKSRLDGAIMIAGGQLILSPQSPASGSGQELLLGLDSINLVGTDGSRGRYMSPEIRLTLRPPPAPSNSWDFEFKAGYVPERDTGTSNEIWILTLPRVDLNTGEIMTETIVSYDEETGARITEERQLTTEVYIPKKVDKFAQLVINSDQKIHNLQALFAEKSAPTDAARTAESAVRAAIAANPTETYIAGQGLGTNIQIDTHKITIQQDLDGVYRGNINLNWVASARDANVSDALARGLIAHSEPVGGTWSVDSKRDVMAAYQAVSQARLLLSEQKGRLQAAVAAVEGLDAAKKAVRYYDTLLEQLTKITDDTFGNQGIILASPDFTNLTLQEQRAAAQAVRPEVVNIEKINSIVQFLSNLLSFKRDEYVQFALGVETATVQNLYSFLVDEAGTNKALEAVIDRDLPPPPTPVPRNTPAIPMPTPPPKKPGLASARGLRIPSSEIFSESRVIRWICKRRGAFWKKG